MNVLHITADWKWTGPADPMLSAILGLRKRGHRVDLACPEAPEGSLGALAERARSRGVEPAYRLERGQGYLPLRDGREVGRLRAFLAGGDYDLVHAHHTRDHLLCARALGRDRTKLVYSWHHGSPVPARPWNRWLFSPRRLRGVTLLSGSLADDFASGFGWDAERVGVIPGCVDTEHYAPRERDAALAAQFGLHEDHCVLGVVARLQPHRRMYLLLDAFARASRSVPELRLLVVGRGTRAARVLDEPVERLGLGDRVIHAGYRREDYRGVLALMDALVFLVPGSDGSCRAVLEAMAQGIPTVSSERQILPETVVDGMTGAVVEEDAERFSAAFVDVARNREVWLERGRAARLRAVEMYRTELQAQRLEDFYQRIRKA